ncbi:MAG: twin-arginine translocation signal domain-containing protein [Planctomycetes bacterium]|nr:twin-arginine translocation signal domain-containing protein [Planctomycetota bacterium]
MSDSTRRDFLKGGLALSAGGLLLPSLAIATETSGDLGKYGEFVNQPRPMPTPAELAATRLREIAIPAGTAPAANARATEVNILGPYHRANVPFRAKITPPLEPGPVLVIRGRVYGLDTRQPLPSTVIDIWQADHQGRYDNDDQQRPPAANLFVNRARIMTDENGYYEYETVHPGAYRIGPNAWRPPHIHYWVRKPNYRELITQLYFRGDQHQREDQFIRQSLIIDLREIRTQHGVYKVGVFDIVLAAR